MAQSQPNPPQFMPILGVLNLAFQAYRINFATYFMVTMIAIIPTTIITLLVELQSPLLVVTNPQLLTPEQAAQLLGVRFVVSLVTFLQIVIAVAPITYLASENYFGHVLGFRAAFSGVQQQFSKVGLGFFLFLLLITGLLLVATIANAILTPIVGIPTFAFILYILLAILGFLAPVLVLESVTINQGLRRALALGKTRFWSVFGLYILVSLMQSVVLSALSLIATLVIPATASTAVQVVASAILTAVAQLLTFPIIYIGFTYLYYDTRNQLEGLDAALRAVGDNVRPHEVQTVNVSSAFVRRDLTNVAILLVIGVILGLAFGSVLNRLVPQL